MTSPRRMEADNTGLNSRVARLEAQYDWLVQELHDRRANERERRYGRAGLTALGHYLEGFILGMLILGCAFVLVLELGNIF